MIAGIFLVLLLAIAVVCKDKGKESFIDNIFTDSNGRRYNIAVFNGRPFFEHKENGNKGQYTFRYNILRSPNIYQDRCDENTGFCVTVDGYSYSAGSIKGVVITSNDNGSQGFTVTYPEQANIPFDANHPRSRGQIIFICDKASDAVACTGSTEVINLFDTTKDCKTRDACSCNMTGLDSKSSYFLTVRSPDACQINPNDGKPKAWPSFGAVFLIILAVVIVVYFFGGWILIKCRTAARGCHATPNYDFWKANPKLFVLGCKYTWSKMTCKPMSGQTAYVPLHVENIDLDNNGGAIELGLEIDEDAKDAYGNQNAVENGNGENGAADLTSQPQPQMQQQQRQTAADMLGDDDEFNPTASAANAMGNVLF